MFVEQVLSAKPRTRPCMLHAPKEMQPRAPTFPMSPPYKPNPHRVASRTTHSIFLPHIFLP